MRISVLAVLAALAAVPAQADTLLTPVSAFVQLNSPFTFVSYSGLSSNNTLQNHTATDASGTLSGGNQGGSDPQVVGSISIHNVPSGRFPQEVDSESWIFYEFAVNGPANQTVSVDMLGSLSANVSTLNSGLSLNSTAYLKISQALDDSELFLATACAGDPSAVSDPCGSTSGPASSFFNVQRTLRVQTDTPYLVNLYANNSLLAPAAGASGNFSASSSVDPTFTLDTSDPAYSLQFSPGLFGASPTPEPASLALVGTAMAGAAFRARRRFRSA